jgi:predicted phosphodiesterase
MVVGICGDVHENKELFVAVLQQMRSRGVTHFIGTGDYSNDPLERLRPNLELIHKQLPALGPNRVYLMPGNWDHYSLSLGMRPTRVFHPARANDIIKQFGCLICDDCVGFGIVLLGGKRIAVSHYPQNVIPRRFVPPRGLVYGENAYPNQLGTMMFDSYSTDPKGFCGPLLWGGGIHLCITAHTHLHGLWTVGSMVEINVGTLSRKKSPSEPFSYGLYYPGDGRVEFLDPWRNAVYEEGMTSAATPLGPDDWEEREKTRRMIAEERQDFVFLHQPPYTVPRQQATGSQRAVERQGVDVVARRSRSLPTSQAGPGSRRSWLGLGGRWR